MLQIDSVNVLARAHTLPPFARLGRYRVEDLSALAYGGRKRALFEYWGHEASLLPIASQPLFRWRMARAARGEGIYGRIAKFGRERRALIDEVRREIADEGALSASELSHEHKGEGGWWGWSDGKRALEWLFWAGEITTAKRRGTFERVYDLTERVLPQAVLDAPTPPEADAQRELMRIAARALGVATVRSLRDYFRLGPEDGKARVAELVEAGELLPVSVEGWAAPAYLHRDARLPRRMDALALLAPFDPLIWQRERAEELFGARIRIEIYTPREKRSLRLLRAAAAAGRPHRRARRPQGRPGGLDPARAGGARRARCRQAGDHRAAGRRAAADGGLAGAGARSRRAPRRHRRPAGARILKRWRRLNSRRCRRRRGRAWAPAPSARRS